MENRYEVIGHLEPGKVYKIISRQHAESLTALLAWYKQTVAAFYDENPCDKKGSEKYLTTAYVDELIEALKVKKGSEDGPEKT